jgi:hypothetical protein
MPAYARGLGEGVGVPLFEQDAQDAPRPGAPDERLEGAPSTEAQDAEAETGPAVEGETAPAVPEVSGVGPRSYATAHGNSVTLNGRTDADFSDNKFHTEGVKTSRAKSCENCEGDDCAHVRGTLVSTFAVSTTVTLPSVDDFPDLTTCQRQRVRNAIRNVLAPHEQKHVQAFRTYNGTIRRPFDLTICRGDFDAAIQNMHDTLQAAREAAAQARSDILDPFDFNVDLDCKDPPPAPAPKPKGARADAGAQAPAAGETEEVEA